MDCNRTTSEKASPSRSTACIGKESAHAPPRVGARVADIPPGSRKIVNLGGPSGIGVFNLDGRFYALKNICPHQGAEICKGEVTGRRFRSGSQGPNPIEQAWGSLKSKELRNLCPDTSRRGCRRCRRWTKPHRQRRLTLLCFPSPHPGCAYDHMQPGIPQSSSLVNNPPLLHQQRVHPFDVLRAGKPSSPNRGIRESTISLAPVRLSVATAARISRALIILIFPG